MSARINADVPWRMLLAPGASARATAGWAAVIALAGLLPCPAQSFRIESFQLDSQSSPTLNAQADLNSHSRCAISLPTLAVSAQPLFSPSDNVLDPQQPIYDLFGRLSAPPDQVLTVPWAEPAFQVDRSFRLQPLAFERNDGQVNARVKFLSREPGYTLFLTPTEAVMTLPTGNAASGAPNFVPTERSGRPQRFSVGPLPPAPALARVLRMRLVGANPAIQVSGEKELRGKVNYFIGNVPARWHTNIPTFAKVRLREVYPGIDLVYYGDEGQLEYDFVVAPGADPNRIAMAIEGADKVTLDASGDLLVRVGDQQVCWRQPRVYQVVEDKRREIAGTYRLASSPGARGFGSTQLISFSVAGYDPAQPLVIDPALFYSTYLGGSSAQSPDNPVTYGGHIAADESGNAYVYGLSDTIDFPTTNAFQAVNTSANGDFDAFVTKFDSAGSMIYSTYLGGSLNDSAGGVAVDGSGNAYVAGATKSPDFPVANAFQAYLGGGDDAFIAKLSPDGASLVYSTYLGGGGQDFAGPLAIDRMGDAYVGGDTGSTDFPTTNALYATAQFTYNAGFVAKLAPSGKDLIYSTYSNPVGDSSVRGLAVDTAGDTYICGDTDATNFPTKNAVQPAYGGGYDGFVEKLGPDGSELLFSTYLGGSGDDGRYGGAISLAPNGDICVALDTSSSDFPLVNPLQSTLRGPSVGGPSDAAVVRMKGDGSSIVFSTYLGGQGYETTRGIDVDRKGNCYVVGETTSPDFPLVAASETNFPDTAHLGGFFIGIPSTGFLAVFKPDGSDLLYSSFFGSPTVGGDLDGVSVDAANNIYLAGSTAGADFLVTNAFQSTLTGANDAFVSKLSPVATAPRLVLTRTGTTLVLTWPAVETGFTLETTDQLGPAANWVPAAEQVVVVSNQNTITLDATNAAEFYRLSQP